MKETKPGNGTYSRLASGRFGDWLPARPARISPIAHARCKNGPVFKWRPARAIGVPEIDAQHMALFEEAERIERAVKAREPQDRLMPLLASLTDHAVAHFFAEEQLMRDVGYPRRAEHVQEHAYMMRRFRSLVPRWKSERDSAAQMRTLLGFLDLWLNTHIPNSDRQIGDFIRK